MPSTNIDEDENNEKNSMDAVEEPSPPPSYRNILIEDLLQWDLPQEFIEAASSFLNNPLEPPKHPHRTIQMSKDAFGSHYMGEHDSKLRRSGYGHCRFVNGDLYHGLWNKDQMDAFGCYWWAQTGTIYVGEWQKGHRHGLGTVLFGPRAEPNKKGLLVTSKWNKDQAAKQLSCQKTI